MGPKAHRGLSAEEVALQKVSKDLQKLPQKLLKESLPETTLNHLEVLIDCLQDDQTHDTRALVFLEASGLGRLVRHLRGTAALHATPNTAIPPSAISAEAAVALRLVLRPTMAVTRQLWGDTSVVPALIDALRDAPDMHARYAAVEALYIFSTSQCECRAMAEAGVFELLLALFRDVGEQAWVEAMGARANPLASKLLKSGQIGARDLERVIFKPGVVEPFTTLYILQVLPSCSHTAWLATPFPALCAE
jgi:hypothetical protein